MDPNKYSCIQKKDKYAILIPAYDPDEQLSFTIRDFYLAGFRHIYIVNDGSRPDSRAFFDECTEKYGASILVHDVNRGKGRALKTGITYIAENDEDIAFIITADADGQHNLSSIQSIIDRIEEDGEASGSKRIYLGVRDLSKENQGRPVPLKSRLGNRITKTVFKYLCGIDLQDTQTGLRAFPVKVSADLLSVDGERYEYETNVLLFGKENAYDFVQVPIDSIYLDNNARSHFDPFKDAARIYSHILRYTLSSWLSAAVDFIVFFALGNAVADILLRTYISRAFSSIVNFSINKLYVFRSGEKKKHQFIKYCALLIVSGTVSGLLVRGMSSIIPVSPGIIKIPVELILFFFNYYIQKNYVYK